MTIPEIINEIETLKKKVNSLSEFLQGTAENLDDLRAQLDVVRRPVALAQEERHESAYAERFKTR